MNLINNSILLIFTLVITVGLFSCKSDEKAAAEAKDEITMIAESPEFQKYFEVISTRSDGRTPEGTQYVNDFLMSNNLIREMILDPCSIVDNELVKADSLVVAFLKVECTYNKAHNGLMEKYNLSSDSLRMVTQNFIDIKRAKALEEQ
jgi:hypothetical protein